MRKMHWLLTLPFLAWQVSGVAAEPADLGENRAEKLEALLQMAVDRFQLNRYVEARAALERLIADDPTDREAYELRDLFGEKILLEMQKYGARPSLDDAERQALQLLGEADYALTRGNLDFAKTKLTEVAAVFEKAGYSDDDFSVKYAGELAEQIDSVERNDVKTLAEIGEKVVRWRERLQSVGNVPLVLLSRAQQYEQAQLRDPERLKNVINNALVGGSGAQRNMLDVARLGVYAVPELLNNLRDERNDTRRTNAHFVLLTMGTDVLLPLCEALKTDDQLLAQQLCLLLGEIRPVDQRAVAYLKAIYDNPELLSSTKNAAAGALRAITGQDAAKLLPAADYFLKDANRYYRGGADIDRELLAAQNTLWTWDPELNDNAGGLREISAPRFILGDLLAEELTYRGLKLATDKTPFEILLASVFLQEKNRTDTLAKLLIDEDASHPDSAKLRHDVEQWQRRFANNARVVYTLGGEHLTGVIEKALRDHKTEVAIGAMEALTVVAGKTGWQQLQKYQATGTSGTGASGDGENADFIDAGSNGIAGAAYAPTTSYAVAESWTPSKINPLITALDNPNPRIAIAAANTLINIGLPPEHPAYQKLLTLLLNGAQENRATVVEIITGDKDLGHKISAEIDRDKMLPLVAADGYAGYQLAMQYPPKDVILLDNRADQFNTLRLQLELRGLNQERLLPLTIITTREHVENIAAQFKNVTGWRTSVFDNISSARAEATTRGNFFDELQTLSKADNATRAVAIVTQPSREERYKLKEALALRAERSMRPGTLTEYSALRNKQKVLGDVFGVRVTYAPVFVDDEIGGYDAMRTVQALRIDPRTRSVPVGVLVGNAEIDNVRADFERFIKDGVVEIINRNSDAQSLLKKIGELKAKNPLAEKHYARALSNQIAKQSAESLAKLQNVKLSPVQEQQLFAVVSDTIGRPEELRIAAANALGHFRAQTQLQPLMNLYAETDQKLSSLCVALIRAIGEIDVANQYLDFKLTAFRDAASPEVQQAVAIALGPAAQSQIDLEKYMENLRVNDPLTIARLGVAGAPEKSADADYPDSPHLPEDEEDEDASDNDEGDEENW